MDHREPTNLQRFEVTYTRQNKRSGKRSSTNCHNRYRILTKWQLARTPV